MSSSIFLILIDEISYEQRCILSRDSPISSGLVLQTRSVFYSLYILTIKIMFYK